MKSKLSLKEKILLKKWFKATRKSNRLCDIPNEIEIILQKLA